MARKPNANSPQAPKMPKFNLTWVYFAVIASLAIALWWGNNNQSSISKEVSYTELKNYITHQYTKEIVVDKVEGLVSITIDAPHILEVFKQSSKEVGTQPRITARYPSADSFDRFLNESKFTGKVSYQEEKSFVWSILINLLPIGLLILFWIFMFRGSGKGPGSMFNVGSSKAKEYDKENSVKVTFQDVAGQEGAKIEIQEIVEFLKNPQKFTELGGKIPKGALLVGPPGTGKTLLAKAVAGEANVPFFSMAGSDFVEMFVGVGASRVRDLFKKAKEKAPSIVFIDEIDAVGRARGNGRSFNGGNDERENTLNQLLTEMDGFGSNSGVIILAATNRVDVLDKALLRAGRFDRQISIDLPDLSERIAIFQVHLKPLKLEEGLDVELLARQTPGFSGADIANVCNEAALIAARRDRENVTKQDFLDAVDRIIGGLEKRTRVMTQAEKRAIAIHEAGHAAVSWLLEHANPLIKVTIVPRGQSLGAAWYLPEERSITTREEMLDEICATLAGRAAEEVFLGRISSGALSDLERVTQRAYGMVAYLGMSESLSHISYYGTQESFQKPYSDETARLIDIEVQNIINTQYARALHLLREYQEKHKALADLLYEHEVIFAADVQNIFGERSWKSRADILLEESANTTGQTSATQAAALVEESEEKPSVSVDADNNSDKA